MLFIYKIKLSEYTFMCNGRAGENKNGAGANCDNVLK